MKVLEVMTASPETCRPDDNLAEAVERLWQANCGALPVTDSTGRVAGILTDRDICIALGTRNQRAADIRVASVMRTNVLTCLPEEQVLTALARMTDRRVRRLPVVDAGGRLTGILSLADIVAVAGGAGRSDVRPTAVVDTLKAICAHPLPVAMAGAVE